MPESYYEKRRRELGITSSSKTSTAPKEDKKSSPELSFYEKRRMELGLQKDTRPVINKPDANTQRANMNEQRLSQQDAKPAQVSVPSVVKKKPTTTETINRAQPNAFEPKKVDPRLVPVATQKGIGSQNVPTKQDWLAQEAAARDKQLTGAPGFIKKPLEWVGNKLDMAQASIPGLADFQQGAGNAIGVQAQTAPTTGGITGKVAGTLGSLAGYSVNPAAIEQNLFTGGYKIANGAIGTKLGQNVLGAAERGIARGANLVNPALNRVGVNVGSNLTNKIAERAVTGGIANALQNTALEMDKGHTSGKDILGSAVSGGVFGAVGDVALHGAGSALKQLFKKNNISDAEIHDILGREPHAGDTLGLPLGRKDAAMQRRGGPVNGTEPIVNPYTFKLPAASEETLNAAHNGDKARKDLTQIDGQIHELQTSYEQRVIEEYKYLKQSMGQGTEPGTLIKDHLTGEVIDKVGSISKNPKWYTEISNKANNYKKPTNKELYALARDRVDNGFADEQGHVPSWRDENNYDETLSALQDVRKQVEQGINEVDPALKVTNTPLKASVLRAPNKPLKSEPVIHATPAQEIPHVQQPDESGTQNYAGNAMAFRQATTQSERTINRNQVVKNLRKYLGVIIDTGRLSGGKGVLGNYKVKPEVVRTAMAEDLQTISHEVGHHLDKKLKLSDNAQYHTELEKVARNNSALNINAYAPKDIPAEGVAEYIRLRLTDPQLAEQLAPQFTKHFDSVAGSKILKGLEASAHDMDTWITQGDFNQAKGLIDFTSGDKKTPFSWDRTYTKFLDDLNPLKLVEKALKGALEIGNESIYKMARLSRGVGERAKLAIKRGIYDDKGNKVSEGLAQIVKPLEKLGINEKDFSLYMSIRHAIDLKAMGKKVPFTDAQISAVMKQMDSPELRSVQQGVIKFNNHLLDILVESQVLSSDAVKAMRQKYPNYVPFMRYFDDDAVAGFKNGGFGAAKGFANITNPIKSMTEEGSTRTIINPIENIIKNTMLVMNAAAKNKVGLQLAELSKIEGAGAWVEALGKGGASPGEHVISVHENGVKQSYKIRDPELYNAMLSLDAESTNSLVKFLGASASLLRAGAVLTPEFTFRNAFRDIIGATINSTQYGFNPIDFAKGMYHVLGRTKTFDQFLSSGGAMSTMMSLDRDANREAMQAVFRKSLKDKTLNIVTSPKELAKMLSGYTPAKTVVGGLRKAAEVSELSTKVGSFNKTLKKTGSIEEAAYTARDLMDFNRAGSSIRQANKAVAFLNAALQGTDKMVRAFKDNPASFMTRAFTTLVLPTIGLYYYNKNLSPEMQEKYNNIPQWQKDNFFLVGIPGIGEFARLPKPFEAGMLFATGTERLMKWFEEDDPEAFKDYGRTILQTFTPPAMITALTPIMEAITNYSFFKGGPIVNQGDMRFEKKDQYGLYTSETAKGIGNILSRTPLKESNFASPKIIDNTIKGYTAGLGQYAVSGIDATIKAAKGGSKVTLPAKKITEQPFVRAFFATSAGGGQVREEFYNAWGKISTKKSSADKNEVAFNDPAYPRLHYGYNVITKLNKQYKLIQNAKDMSAAEKRARLDILDEQMNQVAAKSLGK